LEDLLWISAAVSLSVSLFLSAIFKKSLFFFFWKKYLLWRSFSGAVTSDMVLTQYRQEMSTQLPILLLNDPRGSGEHRKEGTVDAKGARQMFDAEMA
jgi:hypothetical protein